MKKSANHDFKGINAMPKGKPISYWFLISIIYLLGTMTLTIVMIAFIIKR